MARDQVLALCETEADVDAAGRLGAAAKLVALSPVAWLEAQRRVMPTAILEDFYSESDLCDQRYPLLNVELAWMDWLDRSLARSVPELAGIGLPPSRLWFYCLKRLIDPLVVLGFTLSGLVAKQAPTTIWTPPVREPDTNWAHFFRPGPHGRMETPHFSPGSVLPLLLAGSGIEVRQLDSGSAKGAGGAAALQKRGLRAFFSRHLPPWIIDTVRLGSKFSPADAVRALAGSGRGGHRLLVVRGGYDLDPLVRECLRRGAKPEFWSSFEARVRLGAHDAQLCAAIGEGCRRAWPSLDSDVELRRPFQFGRADLFDLARPGLRYFVTHAVGEAITLYLRGRAAIRARGHRAVLAPAGIRATALLEAARAENVPVLIYQHGGFVGTCEHLMWDFTDFGNADTFIVYGEGVRRYFDRRRDCVPRRGSTLRVAGSARLQERLREATPTEAARTRAGLMTGKGRAAVLYVSTVTNEYSRLVAGESYPETLCFTRQAAAIEVMKQYPDVAFVFKPYSDRDNRLLHEVIARSGATNCRVVSSVPLLTLMQAADAILVEFPSTALLEAVTTRKPIVAYIDRESLRLEPEARDLLRKRAVVAETHDVFLHEIRRLVDEGRFGNQADVDDGYLQAFVLDGGSAVTRAWEAVRDAAGLPA